MTSVKAYSISQYPRSNIDEESDRLGYADANVMGYSIREKQYRYTIWMRNSFRSTIPFNAASVIGDELYDYNADPLEKHNVVKDKKYTNTAKRLKEEMLRYFESQVKK